MNVVIHLFAVHFLLSATNMNTILVPLLCFLPLAVEEKPMSKVPVGKETTYVTGPIDKDGYID